LGRSSLGFCSGGCSGQRAHRTGLTRNRRTCQGSISDDGVLGSSPVTAGSGTASDPGAPVPPCSISAPHLPHPPPHLSASSPSPSSSSQRLISLTLLLISAPHLPHPPPSSPARRTRTGEGGAHTAMQKNANRTNRVWHRAPEHGPYTMDKPQTFASYV
jgi:hypothetical protein